MKFLITVAFLLISLVYGSSGESSDETTEHPSKRSGWKRGSQNDSQRIKELQQQYDCIISRIDLEKVRSIVTKDSDASLFLQMVDNYKDNNRYIFRMSFLAVRFTDHGFSYEKTTPAELQALFTITNVMAYIRNNKNNLTCGQCVNLLFFADGSTARDAKSCETRINLIEEFLKDLFPSEVKISIRERYLRLITSKFPHKLHLITEIPSASPMPKPASPQETDDDYPMVPVVSSMPQPTQSKATGMDCARPMVLPTPQYPDSYSPHAAPSIPAIPNYLSYGPYSMGWEASPVHRHALSTHHPASPMHHYADPRVPKMPGHLTYGHYPLDHGISPMHRHALPTHHASPMHHYQATGYHSDVLPMLQYSGSYPTYTAPWNSATPDHLTYEFDPMGLGISPMHRQALLTHHAAGYTTDYQPASYPPVIPGHSAGIYGATYTASSLPAASSLSTKRGERQFTLSKFGSDGSNGKKAKLSEG